MTNRQVLLRERPSSTLGSRHFELVDGAVEPPGPGQVLCRNVLLSIDPANRAWMQGRTYRSQVVTGQVMDGFTLAEVVAQRDTDIPLGAVVACDGGWQEYVTLPEKAVRPITVRGPLTWHLGLLGITGLTAYFGLLRVGRPTPGETLLVSAAAGATGHIVGQLGKLQGSRTVGISGTDAKNALLTGALGFDHALNYRSETFQDDLDRACPDGIDVYFDNVGGDLLDAALQRMNIHGRVVCCGAVSQYDVGKPSHGPRAVPGVLVFKRIRMEGFLVTDFASEWPAAEEELAEWSIKGRIQGLEDIIDGLEAAPEALVGLLSGDNIGKRIVRIGPDPEL